MVRDRYLHVAQVLTPQFPGASVSRTRQGYNIAILRHIRPYI